MKVRSDKRQRPNCLILYKTLQKYGRLCVSFSNLRPVPVSFKIDCVLLHCRVTTIQLGLDLKNKKKRRFFPLCKNSNEKLRNIFYIRVYARSHTHTHPRTNRHNKLYLRFFCLRNSFHFPSFSLSVNVTR